MAAIDFHLDVVRYYVTGVMRYKGDCYLLRDGTVFGDESLRFSFLFILPSV